MHWATVARTLGHLLLVLAAAMLVPVAWGILGGRDGWPPLVWAAGVTALAGGLLAWGPPAVPRALDARDGLLLVVTTWFAVAGFGALPFYLSPSFASYTDAFFEAASGFTTTGATVLARVEALPEPLQFWRCFTHWVGGMGIVLLGIAVLPLVGHGGMHLYRAEFSGARSERLKPRVAETAAALWRIYAALSLALYVALRLAGLDAFEALCHTFSTLGTGGFSTRTASVGGLGNPAAEWILVGFMLAAGISFVQHYRLFVERRPGRVARDYEIQAYLAIAAVATAVVTASLVAHTGYELPRAVRAAAFQVTSILTTTGFVTEDFEQWAPLAQVLLLVLMFVGGCTGSTAGGLKVARIVLLTRVVGREFKRMVERRGVFAVRLGGQAVPEPTIQSLLNLVYLALVVNAAAVVVLAATGLDLLTSIGAVAASMFNVGPGFGAVGPAEHYGVLPPPAKWTLALVMIAGRLEFYTLVVIFTPLFWRR
jgi:trk system potassium uptake protein TrkH